jgi:hypothetical protein
MIMENAPSWPLCLAAKEACEAASVAHGPQSIEAIQASQEVVRLEQICAEEAGVSIMP